MSGPWSADVARGVEDQLLGHWGSEFHPEEASTRRVWGRLGDLFHVEITGVDPLAVRLTGWDRDLTDLIPGGPVFEGRLKDVLSGIDEVTASVLRQKALPAHPRSQPVSVPRSRDWHQRTAEALWTRRRREAGEVVDSSLSPEETVALLDEVWPGVAVQREDDEWGRVALGVRPFGGNGVDIGISRRGTRVVPVADGEGGSYLTGLSRLTDGSRSQVLSALEAADEWLRRTAPVDEVLRRPVIE